MKCIHTFVAILVLATCGCKDKTISYTDPILINSQKLIERVTPGYSSQFVLEKILTTKNDTFYIGKKESHILLKGNTSVAIATAYYQYLKKNCHVEMSWCGDQMKIPKVLPLPKHSEGHKIYGKHRVYFNYCTFSYSMPWWTWERWQREIDFMAMNGINMPLAVTGLEGVWYNTLTQFGFSDKETREFLAGPTFLAWQWMTNLEGHGGPLPKSWIDSHIQLGQQILERERELGMTPILQGFSGYVPRALISKYPEANILQEGKWCGLKGTAQLDPLDPLFTKLGTLFLQEEEKLFGKSGFYAADPFHEGAPPQNSKEYLNAVGNNIYKLLSTHDSNATWVMQAWSIRKEIATAAPKDKLLVLDLNGETYPSHDNFWGYPFIAGNLHNFGNRINMHGDMPLVASNQYQTALKSAPNVIGSGIFMEGINQNPAWYAMTFEMPLHAQSINPKQWLHNYATRRYGTESSLANQAWDILLAGPYSKGTNGVENSSIIAARPALNVKKSGPNAGFHIPYNPKDLIHAEELLLKASSKLKESEGYRYDLVDIERQILSNLGQEIHKKAAESFKNKNKTDFQLHSQRFIELLADVDYLLSSRKEFSFQKWISDARSWGTTTDEKELYDKNASLLITQWGADMIFDYAWKEWSGLIDQYYKVRWTKFYQMLQEKLDHNQSYSEEGLPQVYGRETLNANDFYKKLDLWEKQWINTPKHFNSKEINRDEIEIVKELQGKYSDLFSEYYK